MPNCLLHALCALAFLAAVAAPLHAAATPASAAPAASAPASILSEAQLDAQLAELKRDFEAVQARDPSKVTAVDYRQLLARTDQVLAGYDALIARNAGSAGIADKRKDARAQQFLLRKLAQ